MSLFLLSHYFRIAPSRRAGLRLLALVARDLVCGRSAAEVLAAAARPRATVSRPGWQQPWLSVGRSLTRPMMAGSAAVALAVVVLPARRLRLPARRLRLPAPLVPLCCAQWPRRPGSLAASAVLWRRVGGDLTVIARCLVASAISPSTGRFAHRYDGRFLTHYSRRQIWLL